MFQGLSQLFGANNKDLRKRIYLTLFCLGIFCLGTAITIPWATALLDSQDIGALEIFNVMSGGGLKNFSIFALGVSPYITASIITQLLQMDILASSTPSRSPTMRSSPWPRTKRKCWLASRPSSRSKSARYVRSPRISATVPTPSTRFPSSIAAWTSPPLWAPRSSSPATASWRRWNTTTGATAT